MPEITIVAFNYGNAGKYVNGPGMCLVNFVKKLRNLKYKVNVYTQLPSNDKSVKALDDTSLMSAIKRSDILHHWSGIGPDFVRAINFAEKLQITTLVGPNVLDTVNLEDEQFFLKQIKNYIILTVNERLRFQISKAHQIPLDIIDLLLVGPDEDLWKPISEDNGKILWKGNSRQYVKDVSFGLEVAKCLPEYDFEFVGYPNPYVYSEHIKLAKSCHLYFTTSLSETMGLGLAESLMSGLPAITHPKIYLSGENYRFGILVSRDLESYCSTIREIMEDDTLHKQLSQGAIKFSKDTFSKTVEKYSERYLN